MRTVNAAVTIEVSANSNGVRSEAHAGRGVST